MLLDVESNEEFSLIRNSLGEFLDREWKTLGAKKDKVSDNKVKEIFEKIKDLGIFQLIKENRVYGLLINEILGENLLPGIVSTTAMLGLDYPVTIGVNYVPEADKAEMIITPRGIAKRDEVELKEVESPDPTLRIYKVNGGNWKKLELDFNRAVIMASAQIIGHGLATMKQIVEYAKNRVAFGKPIGSYQAIKHRVVDDVIGLELVRSRYILGNIENPYNLLNHAYRKAFRAALDSIQFHGGIGFTSDLDLHLHLKRIIALQKIFKIS
ncbi:acyl-CoA dehydrogenase family protein [Sulfolobus acidocaldarius]|uniref:Conserved protein n=4 Tax=Sulfolobus acidocaldarius TaxID=2285 RepID=Q4J9V2_SULAC|nr:acyl-CoA dehydrogenase family protein [Sulfolobus acidocaldarius]AAY80428.1 conserved protein [Sulfolobus acidocaldarius DSM 639]AGE71012.1 hypothetical protein SacN8_05205 [Sulfolobus acidocaldarius N8]AGE73283.1 hypothetical protein SacRon12I_05195 [Sulfolobus acidocaldarius Ron12/I]ALU28691.1 acyl-CoA dehydrogenase [Sulfolobus acidocaldarius]ALU31409.1 acyl-CoA dehydrogenase [Sulfolobus acidocaldarius]